MTENGKELEELRRAHAALESRVETVLPTLATKADLEAMGTRLGNEMHRQLDDMRQMFDRRFGGIEHNYAESDKRIDKMQDKMDDRFNEMQRKMDEGFKEMHRGFIQVWTWIAGSMLAIVLAIAGVIITILARNPAAVPAGVANPAIAYHFHGQAPAPSPVAPSPQP
ncbi:MAG TPA: hypothetical protein VFT37_06630 [Telluria sp.]|nr:hypothetical protein [Telluria sp.]